MPEPIIEKKIEGHEGIIQRLSDHFRKLQEENTERENKLISDLKAQHAQEIEILKEENNQRVHAQCKALVMALLRVKSDRDRILLAFYWIAIGCIVLMVFGGLIHENISKVFTFAALAGFLGPIIITGHDLKRSNSYLKLVGEGKVPSGSVWNEEDDKPSRFLIFGLISAFFLGLTLLTNSSQKTVDFGQTTQLTDNLQVPVRGETKGSTEDQVANHAAVVPSTPAKTVPAVTSTDRPIGNGGNFVGGVSRK